MWKLVFSLRGVVASFLAEEKEGTCLLPLNRLSLPPWHSPHHREQKTWETWKTWETGERRKCKSRALCQTVVSDHLVHRCTQFLRVLGSWDLSITEKQILTQRSSSGLIVICKLATDSQNKYNFWRMVPINFFVGVEFHLQYARLQEFRQECWKGSWRRRLPHGPDGPHKAASRSHIGDSLKVARSQMVFTIRVKALSFAKPL